MVLDLLKNYIFRLFFTTFDSDRKNSMVALRMSALHTTDRATILNYYLGQDDGADDTFFDGTIIESRRKYAEIPVLVKDLRGHENRFDLNKHGFQVLTHCSAEKNFTDNDRIKNTYYPESAQLLQSMYVQSLRTFHHDCWLNSSIEPAQHASTLWAILSGVNPGRGL